jgi:hypothetical protein
MTELERKGEYVSKIVGASHLLRTMDPNSPIDDQDALITMFQEGLRELHDETLDTQSHYSSGVVWEFR